MSEQTILEGIVIMAYNAGRAHEKSGAFGLEDGRAVVAKAISEFVQDVDPGDLALPIATFLKP